MYKGKQESQVEVPSRTSKIDGIVLRLMKNYLNKGHSLYMDNYYNSLTLSNTLLEHKTHSTGTLRKNRKGNSKFIIDKKLKKGEHIWRRKNSVYVKLIQSANRFG